MNENLIIRADASTRIGTGHIMRCIALAQAWQDRGGVVTFLSHCDSGALRQRIIEEGFDIFPIEKPYPDPDDLSSTLKVLSAMSHELSATSPWLVLDGYHFTPGYQKVIRENGYRLLVIDDMAHLDHYYADILLNQNIHASSLSYSCDMDTMKLLGCEYVLLRREFLKYKDWKREISDKAKKILVTIGGSDPNNVTLKVIRALNILNDPDLEVKIVAGPANPNIKSLENGLNNPSFNIHLLPSVSNMPELMVWADIAISAGGSTCLEMAYMGLPNVILILAENQLKVAKSLDTYGISINAGWHAEISEYDLSKMLEKIIIGHKCFGTTSENRAKLVDGSGVNFVLTEMESLSQFVSCGDQLKLRLATLRDSKLIWEWANEPHVRVNSFNKEAITFYEHIKWFKKKLMSLDTVIWILYREQMPVAQIRYDRIQDDTAEIGFSVAFEHCGMGLGQTILKLTSDMACDKLGVRHLRGVVLNKNKSSGRAFTKAGFIYNGPKQVNGKPCHIWKYHCSCFDR